MSNCKEPNCFGEKRLKDALKTAKKYGQKLELSVLNDIDVSIHYDVYSPILVITFKFKGFVCSFFKRFFYSKAVLPVFYHQYLEDHFFNDLEDDEPDLELDFQNGQFLLS